MRAPLRLLSALACLLSNYPAASQTLTRVANLPVSGALGVAANGTLAYLTGASFTLDTYNLSQPAAPAPLGSVATGTPYPRRVVAGGARAYVLGWGLGSPVATSGLRAFSLSAASVPVPGATLLTLGPPDQYVAATETLVGVGSNQNATLAIYDTNLTLLASVSTSTPANELTMSGTAAYLQRGSSVDVYNLANPAAPVRSTTFSGNILATSGALAFGLTGSTLLVYDISNPLLPVLKGSTTTNGGTLLAASGNRVYTTGVYAAIGGSSSQLQAFDVSIPTAPRLLATAAAGSTATALAASGDAAYLVDGSRFQVYALAGVLAAAAPASSVAGLYPNPAHGTLMVPSAPVAAPISIYDTMGRLQLQATVPATQLLDISTLAKGLYLVRLGAATQRLVVD
jgi:hypothetical protein